MNARQLMAAGLAWGLTVGATQADWPSWRGPEDNGFVPHSAAVKEWSLDGKNLVWKSAIGGRTTPIVMNGRLYFNGPIGDGVSRREHMVCLDAYTGKLLWEDAFNVFHTDIVENRVGWTAPVGDPLTGNIYVQGTGGELICYNRDGKVHWKISLTEMFGRISGYGGRIHNPVIDENRVLMAFSNSSWGDMAPVRHRILALNKDNGQVLWWTGPGDQPADPTTYAMPLPVIMGGVRQIVFANGEGTVYGLKARTGEEIWKFRFSKRGLNVTPIVHGNRVIIAHSEENWDNTEMGRVSCIEGTLSGDITSTGEVWRADGLGVGYSSPAYANGRVYVVDNSANLFCLEVASGEKQWEYSLGRVGKGSPVVTADGYIYVGEQNGIFHILQDMGSECIAHDKEEFKRTDGLVDELFGSPAVDGGRVYFQTRYGTYCLGVPGTTMDRAKPGLKVPEKADPTYNGPITITPAEITLSPGEKLKFVSRRFSADSMFQKSAAGFWSVKGVKGSIEKDGTFTAAEENVFSAGSVDSLFEGVEGKARVRIIPKPPFTVDFENIDVDAVPPGWIGVARKTKVVERDGSKVLMKMADNPAPPFMRIQPYITTPLEGGHVIEADVLGGIKETASGTKFLPDMGLVNTRYNFALQGNDQLLRIESWSAMPRIRKDVPFIWQSDVWYRLKFAVTMRGAEALLQGKVWKRGESEPAEWTIELTDPSPNKEGSAGLYGFSPGTTAKSKGPEVFYDNVKVFKNE